MAEELLVKFKKIESLWKAEVAQFFTLCVDCPDTKPPTGCPENYSCLLTRSTVPVALFFQCKKLCELLDIGVENCEWDNKDFESPSLQRLVRHLTYCSPPQSDEEHQCVKIANELLQRFAKDCSCYDCFPALWERRIVHRDPNL